MIQCIICEDWYHGRVSHYSNSSFCSNKIFIGKTEATIQDNVQKDTMLTCCIVNLFMNIKGSCQNRYIHFITKVKQLVSNTCTIKLLENTSSYKKNTSFQKKPSSWSKPSAV